jgi:hypothetical protein
MVLIKTVPVIVSFGRFCAFCAVVSRRSEPALNPHRRMNGVKKEQID